MRTSHNFFSIRAQQHRFHPQRKNCNEEKEKEEGRIGKLRGTFLTLLRPSSPWKKREGKGGDDLTFCSEKPDVQRNTDGSIFHFIY